MGSIHDGACVKCGADADDGGGGLCRTCAAIPAASTAKVQAFLLDLGWDIAVPARENAQYDLVMWNREMQVWQGVQVKTAYNGIVNTCRTTATGREPYSNEVHWFAVVDDNEVYMIHTTVANNGGRMHIGTVKEQSTKHLSFGGVPGYQRAGESVPPLSNGMWQSVEDIPQL